MRLLVTALILLLSTAFAHAELEGSVPAANATLKTLPRTVTLSFSEAVELRLSRFKVYPLNLPPERLRDSAALNRAARGLLARALQLKNDASARADSGPTTTARASKTVTLALKPSLKPGAYIVMWKNLSTDGHTETDFFVFVYAP